MGLFKFLKRKDNDADTKVLVVEPLPVRFTAEDFNPPALEALAPETEEIPQEIIAVISAAVQMYMEQTTVRSPLLRRQADRAWRIHGINHIMQSRK